MLTNTDVLNAAQSAYVFLEAGIVKPFF